MRLCLTLKNHTATVCFNGCLEALGGLYTKTPRDGGKATRAILADGTLLKRIYAMTRNDNSTPKSGGGQEPGHTPAVTLNTRKRPHGLCPEWPGTK